MNLEEERNGKLYKARLLLGSIDVDDRSKEIATCQSLAEFLLIVPEGMRDGTVRPAYDILLKKLGFLQVAADDIRAVALEGRTDGKHVHSAAGPFFATQPP